MSVSTRDSQQAASGNAVRRFRPARNLARLVAPTAERIGCERPLAIGTALRLPRPESQQ